MAKRDTVNKSK